MKNKWLVLLLIFSLAINIAAAVTIGFNLYRHRQFETRWESRRNEARLLGRDLCLSPEQRSQIREHKRCFRNAMQAGQQELRKCRMDVIEHLLQPEADTLAINSLLEKMARLRAGNEKQLIRNLLQYKAMLSEEQFELLLKKFNYILKKQQRPFGRGRGIPGHLHKRQLPYPENK